MPAPLQRSKARGHVREDLASQLFPLIAFLPDQALKLFQRGRLAVAIHQRFDDFDERGAIASVQLLLLPQSFEQRLDIGLRVVPGKIGTQIRACVRNQRLIHEGDRRRRAFDIQQDGSDRVGARLDHVRCVAAPGTYDGPKQIG